ncbi:MAG: ribonuclease Y [Candidatus Omnitrophota bacterium]|nr:ribonuclease Y [Candidatus Omnitrophota bacterium]
MTVLVSGLIAFGIGVALFLLGYVIRKFMAERKVKRAEKVAGEMLERARKESEARRREAELEVKDQLYKARIDFERETKDRRQEILALEKRITQKEENLDRKVDILEEKENQVQQREKGIYSKEKAVEDKKAELGVLIDEEKDKLQKISGLSADEAKRLLLSRMESEVRREGLLMIKRVEDESRETADKKAKEILSLAIQRYAADQVVESTVSVVNLPSDEMKGRIIGREGRNIRALEAVTGVDIIIDDTPEAVVISGFDPVRRETARLSLEKLVVDGRIHPARIEEVVAKTKKELAEAVQEAGRQAVFDTGVHRIHPEMVKLLGRLKYRTSYGQNVLQHSKEVSQLMGIIAAELGEDVKIAKRIGLLHDIGKALTHEIEGPHAKLSADLAKRYGESPQVIHAISAHHQDEDAKSLMAVLIQAADAISAARPGARRETLETYVKRLEKLESIANAFKGVEKAYAIQAGREVRVIVQPNKIDDLAAVGLAREITGKVEEQLEYPGQVKVTVIRETRAIDYAK